MTVPAHLRETLHHLLRVDALPPALRDPIQHIKRTSEGYSVEETPDRAATGTGDYDNKNGNDNDKKIDEIDDHDEEYISRQTLSEIAKWARSERGLAALEAESLGMLAPFGIV